MKKNFVKTVLLGTVMAAATLFAGCSNLELNAIDSENDISAARAVSGYDTSLSGNYFIKNAYSGLYLDVANGATSNGTNIQQWSSNGSTAQQFNLVYLNNGYYAIKTVCSGSAQALDVWGKSKADGTNIATYKYSGGANQQFKFVKQSDGSYAILTRMSGDASCLDDYNWSKSNGGNVCQWNYWGGACQKWVLTKVSSSSSSSSSSNTTTTSTGFTKSSVEFSKNLKAGWNLGNTLECKDDGNSGNQWVQDLYAETAWGLPKTTKAMMTGIKNAGFKAVRIPVSWHNHIYDSTNYTIDAEWMARVKEVVDYAYSNGLYVILNMHHDNLSASEYGTYSYNNRKVVGFVLDSNYKNQSNAYIKAVWTQIANTFKGYDEKLIFEVLNEPRNVGSSDEWWVSGTTASNYCSLIKSYEETAISAIRTTGGNNAKRYLMVPGYAGSASYLDYFTMPSDSASDKLILSVHAYNPYNFAMYNSSYTDTTFDSSDKSELNTLFANLYNKYVKNGIGVVIGEASASNKGNLSAREAWATYYFGTALNTYGMPTFLWDNGVSAADAYSGENHGYFNRSACTWYFPSIIRNALKAVGITPGI